MLNNKYICLVVGICLYSFAASAKTPYGMAGCGLGSVLMGSEGGQLSASTTNGSSFNQTFGITSGSSNCLETSKAAALNAQQEFMYNNYGLLAKEIAQGDGEALRAFANTFGCSKEIYSNFATKMQGSYSKIFSAPGSMAALSVVQGEIRDNTQLSQSCSLVSCMFNQHNANGEIKNEI